VTVVPAALRSFTSSPCVVLGLFCTFRMITDTAQGDILHGAPDLERLTVVWCCFHLRIIAPSAVCSSPRCLPMVVCVWLYVHECVCVFVSVCLCVCVSVCLFVCRFFVSV